MGRPPLKRALQLTVAAASPGVTPVITGGSGTVAGMTALEGDEDGPVPKALVAVTLKVYDTPFLRPPTDVDLMLPGTVAEPSGGDEVTV